MKNGLENFNDGAQDPDDIDPGAVSDLVDLDKQISETQFDSEAIRKELKKQGFEIKKKIKNPQKAGF